MEPILVVENLVKRFGGLTAVNRVSLELYPGEVVGLLGDNGAGKSTLIKMVSGVYRPDDGHIFFQGKERHLESPMDARDMGIETIYQDLALAENLDVGSNIFLGREPTVPFLGGLVNVMDRHYMLEESKRVLNRLDIRIPTLEIGIRNLSGGQRQAVAIARAIYWDAKLMIMDEPTAALGVAEQRKVLNLVRLLRDQGVPVILISHNMQDVFAVADRMVVMRRGIKAGERMTRETTVDEIVSLMVGAEAVEANAIAMEDATA
jgi:ABC-type sugar transport system ATPase subunit